MVLHRIRASAVRISRFRLIFKMRALRSTATSSGFGMCTLIGISLGRHCQADIARQVTAGGRRRQSGTTAGRRSPQFSATAEQAWTDWICEQSFL